ncbi:MAG: signal peptide peptidase SppA [Drouetiella hepatica Uher 2000/2452]|jgi:protease-4|uniref:Protease 4 n=1 Tax=Drouetiella hepatica Uher 2000/2452 TaxID=904376 RepID=A0A951QEB4_9CYAN|nr:signal peptide peptidase SppA [Drouetiella hepatica Uher 2000/2452]
MRDFFKYTFATLAGIVLFCTLGIAGLTALLVTIASSSSSTEPQVEADSILTFDLSEEITDSSAASEPRAIIGAALSGGSRSSIPLRTAIEAIRRSTTDDRIKGLLLYGSIQPTGSGFATLQEVRQALEAFRQSGKPIFAYDDVQWQEKDYYLASVANTVLLNPSSLLEINGFSSESTFFAGALEKYGVGIQILRVGKFKAATESLTRSQSSPEAKAQTQALLTDLWNEFATAAAKSRKLTPQKMQEIADRQGLLMPEEAKSVGLIDKIAYEDEIVAELQGLTGQEKGSETLRQIDLSNYAAATSSARQSSSNQVAVIYAEGDIVSGEGGTGQIGGDALARLLRKLRQDDSTKAVVLRVNSPGGSATASALVAREMSLTQAKKPVIVSMGTYAASGGYQISANASQIFASPTTITGSIGVFGVLPNVQGISNSNGITWDTVKTARLADGDTVSRPKTPEELAISQRVVDRIYDQFISLVAESRRLPKTKVAEIAQGRVWSGLQAQKIGLVDQLGGLEDAIKAAVKAANLSDDWQIEEYPKPRSFEEQLGKLLGTSTRATTPVDPLTQQMEKLGKDLEILRSMNDPLGVYSRLPFNSDIR